MFEIIVVGTREIWLAPKFALGYTGDQAPNGEEAATQSANTWATGDGNGGDRVEEDLSS